MKTIGIVILCYVGFLIAGGVLESITRKRLPKKSTDELKSMFSRRRNVTCFHQAALELKKRGEDIRFTFPTFIDMALLPGVQGMIGRGCLQSHFGGELSGVDLSGKHMSAAARDRLTEIRKQLEKPTNA